jgi:hypothetical protein
MTSGNSANRLTQKSLFYSIDKVKIVDSFGNSYCQNNYYDTTYDLWYNNYKTHFRNSSFFDTDTGTPLNQQHRFSCLPFSSNVESDIFHHTYNGAVQIKENSKFIFKSGDTVMDPCIITMIFYSPSILNLEPGKIEVINSANIN